VESDGRFIGRKSQPIQNRRRRARAHKPTGQAPARIVGFRIVVPQDFNANAICVETWGMSPLNSQVCHAKDLIIVREQVWAFPPTLFVSVKVPDIPHVLNCQTSRTHFQIWKCRMVHANAGCP
jgi:hypothetical protein